MRQPTLYLVVAVLVLLAFKPGAAVNNNVVVQWNNVLLGQVRALNISSQEAQRQLALLNLGELSSLTANRAAGGSAQNETAVAALAAHYILSQQFPWAQGAFDAALKTQLAGLPDSALNASRSLAVPAASALLASRLDDGARRWVPFTPAPANGPLGAYQFTPNQTAALYPQLATVTPFVAKDTANFSKGYAPYPVGSPQYNADYEYVRQAGGTDTATPANKSTALFWADGAGTATIIGRYNLIAASLLPANTSLYDTALLLAKLNAAAYDANIIAWGIKYSTLHWRPITAIRQGDPAHAPVAGWTPVLATPAHPEYPSTHTVAAAAAGAVLERYFGTDNVPFSTASEGTPAAPPRNFTSFTAAAKEVGDSRVYGGVHFPQASADGLPLGKAVAYYVWTHFDGLLASLASGGGSSAAGGNSSGKAASGRRLLL